MKSLSNFVKYNWNDINAQNDYTCTWVISPHHKLKPGLMFLSWGKLSCEKCEKLQLHNILKEVWHELFLV